jgi:hypothetical protein
VRLARSVPLVTYGDPDEVATVVQFADDAMAGRVHDGVGDQLGDDECGRVAGVLAERPAGQPGARHPPGESHRPRARGQFEAEPALHGCVGARPGRRGGTEVVGGGFSS